MQLHVTGTKDTLILAPDPKNPGAYSDASKKPGQSVISARGHGPWEGFESGNSAASQGSEVGKNKCNLLCPTAPPRRSQRGSQLSFALYIPQHPTVLRTALTVRAVRAWGNVASVLSQAPWLVTMSHHKHWVFLIAGRSDLREFRLCVPDSSQASGETRGL